ncbi:hypothetical protein WDZ92_47450, partial [Nostoc sp. NIES-2111]
MTAAAGDPVRVEVLPGGSIDSTAAPDVPAIGTTAETGATEIILGGPVTGGAGVLSTSTRGAVTIRGPGAVTADTGDGISVMGPGNQRVRNPPSLAAVYGIGAVEVANGTAIMVDRRAYLPGSSGIGGNIAIGVKPAGESEAAAHAARLFRPISRQKGIDAKTNGGGPHRIAHRAGGPHEQRPPGGGGGSQDPLAAGPKGGGAAPRAWGGGQPPQSGKVVRGQTRLRLRAE